VTCCVVTTKCVEVVKPVVVEKKVEKVEAKKEEVKPAVVVENKVAQKNTAKQEGDAVAVGLIATNAQNVQVQQQQNMVSTATKDASINKDYQRRHSDQRCLARR
jgi:hypothetical protein